MALEVEVSLVTATGTMRTLPGGTVTFDQNWSPFGQAQFEVPLVDWEATGLDPFARAPVTVHIDTLDDGIAAVSNWRFLLHGVSVDHAAATARLELATWELLLQETIRQDTAWTPPDLPLSVNVVNLLGKLLVEIGGLANTLDTAGDGGTSIPVDDVLPWEPGQSAWEYIERYRTMAGTTWTVGIEDHPETIELVLDSAVLPALSTVGNGYINHRRTFGGDEYADAVTVVWRWSVGTTDYIERETAYAGALTDWRDARVHREIERRGPPYAGLAQRIVDHMHRHRYLETVERPVSRFTIRAAPNLNNWRARTYRFEAVPTVTATLITEFP